MADPHEPKPPTPARFEETALTRIEYISALVHFYRGEMSRAVRWRMRLDITTNWAILSVMGLVTFTLGERQHSHAAILLGMALLHTFLIIEARRYRLFDVWQNRVRLIEKNFYGPVIRRDLQSPMAKWGEMIAEDLLFPTFKMSHLQAVRARLMRNYWSLFLVLLATWVLKLALHASAETEPWLDRMAIGVLPWWAAPTYVLVHYGYLVGVAVKVKKTAPPERQYREPSEAREYRGVIDL